MFYNFLVAPQHRDYLRFLWVDESMNIKDYRMTVHLFGAKSSPGVATFGLRKIATSPEAARFLKDDFYVDDGVTSVTTTDQAKQLITITTEICAQANIRLHKFLSNNKDVLAEIPESERGESAMTVNIFTDKLPNQRTLGMEWCLEEDTFKFNTTPTTQTPTKRHILSTVAQIYDPMGLIAPFVLKGKLTLQRVTAEEKAWDQLVSPQHRKDWEVWTGQLSKMSAIEIPRCFKPEGNIISTELHHFGDASQVGYGACSYLRKITDTGTIKCNLIIAKSRVAPLKKLTIPRLELQGALTASRLAETLRNELRLKIDREIFWTDSQITLGYISNDTKHFHTYVANRVSEIRASSEPEQWRHVASHDNPADIASRGATPTELYASKLWTEGPDFLKEADISSYTNKDKVDTKLPDNDPEVRQITTFTTTTTVQSNRSMTERFTKYSSYERLVRSIAILKQCARKKQWQKVCLTNQDLKEAEVFIFRTTQKSYYPTLEKEKNLVKLNPLLDKEGVLRVGGRVTKAPNLTAQERQPIIIPKYSHIAELIIEQYHKRIHHLGRRSTLAAIREAGYWIVNGTGHVKSWMSKCIDCRRLRRPTETQLMGQLPKERLEQTPPFTNIGIDAFGPFYVKDRRTELKRWGLLITCLYSRAVHIEILEDMSTSKLIQALRCFMAIRGPITTITCDNGMNFTRMNNETLKEFHRAKTELKEHLLQNRIEFKFNSANSSHQGGAMERLIRSVRAVLNGMSLKFKSRLDTQSLRTFFHEAANIVNNRPTTATSMNDLDDQIITPNQLLTMKRTPLVAPAPGSFPPEELYNSRQWKASQYLANEFWIAWKAEYLNTLTMRQKWTKTKENIKVGDLVLLKDERTARNDWKIGRVTETIPGEDGLVRNVVVEMANRNLDRKGKRMEEPTLLRRSIQKIIMLLHA